MADDPIAVVALLTQTNVNVLGTSLKKVYRIDETPRFAELLQAIDNADRDHWRRQDGQKEPIITVAR